EALAPWPVQAAAGLRDPASWYASVYGYALSRRPQPPWAQVREAALAAERGAAALAADVAQSFPGPAFWTTAAYRADPSSVHKRLAGPGPGGRLQAARKRVNASLSGPAMGALMAMRARGEPVDREALRDLRRAAPIRREGPWRPWSEDDLRRLDRRWRDEIKAIRAQGLRIATAPGEMRPRGQPAKPSTEAAAQGGRT
ncbi:MAG: hypothetical protein AAFU61_13875, partial [Pseudomonadota bacterium]